MHQHKSAEIVAYGAVQGYRTDMSTSSSDLTLANVLAARKNVYRYLSRTPLLAYAGLSECVGTNVYVKHENHHAVGAFKVRGGVNLAAHLSKEERRAGLYTASTGNHGQSIAFAGQVTGTPVRVAVPEGANPTKVVAMRGLGAEVIAHGRDFDEAREWMQGEASQAGAGFVGPTDTPLILGVATSTVEIFEDLPEVDVIMVPVGAGSGASAACLVAKSMNPSVEVIAVQAAKAPAVYESWKAGRIVAAGMETSAEGLATRVAFDNTLRIMGDPATGLDDFLLVSDEAMEHGVRLLLEHTHNIAEPAGAATIAGAIQIRERLAGRNVVVVLSGGNISQDQLKRILER